MKEQIEQLQAQLADLQKKFEASETARQAAEQKVAEAEKAQRVAAAQASIANLLKESKLPEPAAKKLAKQFETAETVEGVAEAIKEEQEYIKSVTPGKGVQNMGESNREEETRTVKPEDMEAAFKALGLSEVQAKLAAASR